MAGQDFLARQKALVESLAARLQEDTAGVRLFETHISWVIVAGPLAYKFKKAVRFDFLDFSTLESRLFYCREELRLNRRLAPGLYLDVVAVTGNAEHPEIDGAGAPIEYAVRMRSFEQEALWSFRLKHDLLSRAEAGQLAGKIAGFHQAAACAPANSGWATPEGLRAIADANLREIGSLLRDADERSWVEELQGWLARRQEELRGGFANRRTRGYVRECHGDLHSGNILTIDGAVEVFDCIEFNEDLRWTDVMNDTAFVCMDLQFHDRQDLAALFLNRYLEITGDYDGLAVFDYYRLHLALVRCKVELMRRRQLPGGSVDAASLRERAIRYLGLARDGMRTRRAALMITHGFSGCGKSTFAAGVVEALGAVQLRSDVERKRLHGMASTERGGAALYQQSASERTYRRLLALARQVILSGRPAIVDAAFLRRDQRGMFARLADELGIPFFVFDIRASEATLRRRLALREQIGKDPSDAGVAVLEQQMASHDPLGEDESGRVIPVDFESGADQAAVRKLCAPLREALDQDPD